MCFHCGSPLSAPCEPPPAGEFCPHCGEELPSGLTACFECGKPLDLSVQDAARLTQAATQKPVEHAQTVGKKNKPVIAAVVIIALLLGGALGGHYMGLFTLPFLSSSNDPAEPTPSISNTPTPTATPDNNNTPSPTTSIVGAWLDELAEFVFTEDGRFYMIVESAGIDEYEVRGGTYTASENKITFIVEYHSIYLHVNDELYENSYIEPIADMEYFISGNTMVWNNAWEFAQITPSDRWSFSHRERLLENQANTQDVRATPPSHAYNPHNIHLPPDIEFSVDNIYLFETPMIDIISRFRSFSENYTDEVSYIYYYPAGSGAAIFFEYFHIDERYQHRTVVNYVVIQHAVSYDGGYDIGNNGFDNFLLFGKYRFGEQAPTLLYDFTGIHDYSSLPQGGLVYDDGYKTLEIIKYGELYAFDYTQGDKAVLIFVQDNYIVHFEMRDADVHLH